MISRRQRRWYTPRTPVCPAPPAAPDRNGDRSERLAHRIRFATEIMLRPRASNQRFCVQLLGDFVRSAHAGASAFFRTTGRIGTSRPRNRLPVQLREQQFRIQPGNTGCLFHDDSFNCTRQHRITQLGKRRMRSASVSSSSGASSRLCLFSSPGSFPCSLPSQLSPAGLVISSVSQGGSQARFVLIR